MISLRTTIMAAAVATAALASGPASADLMIWLGTNGAGGDANCANAAAHNCSGNTTLATSGTYNPDAGDNWTYSLTLIGQQSSPNAFNLTNFDLTGTGTITIFATETDLTFGQAAQIVQTFDVLTASDVNETRYLYLDSTNQGLTTTLLGCVTNQNTAGCSADTPNTIIKQSISGLTGPFSLTEEIVATSTVDGQGDLNSEDKAQLVPEPISLSLFGTGLVALGALTRRRKSKKAA